MSGQSGTQSDIFYSDVSHYVILVFLLEYKVNKEKRSAVDTMKKKKTNLPLVCMQVSQLRDT